jgi:hypothetical protein
MADSPDPTPVCPPDARRKPNDPLDSTAPARSSGADPVAVGLGAVVEPFIAGTAAGDVPLRTLEWLRMIDGSAVL